MKGDELAPVSEDSILSCIDRHFKVNGAHLLMGRGDDCAILKNAGSPYCISADMFLEDIHFRRSYFNPQEVGHKALAVNLSDLAACGARPVAFTLCLGLPDNIEVDWLDKFFGGMASLANKYQLDLAGGDLSKSDKIHISISIFGERNENCSFLGRGGSRPGDILFIAGNIGLSRVGLNMLEKTGRAALLDFPESCKAHLLPEPQIEAGLIFSRVGYNSRPPALMDLSDGVAIDLPRLLGWNRDSGDQNKLGANLTLNPQGLHPELLLYSQNNNLNPVMEALLGGEDYALLSSCAPDLFIPLQGASPHIWKIGEVNASGKIVCNGSDISNLKGFDHFADKQP